ncbi:MAG TPA: aldo/keto reductase [Candidatus Polarisedimenticolia bacterium]|nr:aldo/keto reductase [Candidatus Polarisedimenticolia bacterium]
MSERRATPEGTADYAARFRGGSPHGYAPFGTTGLTVSRLGFGGYRVDDETPAHRQALEAALAAGCNLIDTSTNYTDGASERLIGQVLGDGETRGTWRRDQMILVSKIGYVQGQNLALAEERERAGRPFPEMVKYMDGCWHCVHPDFLADQLARSRARLRVDALDVCLLHNPEYFLADARKRHAGDLDAVRARFYARLRNAFAFLEGAVGRGEIRFYGVSSNTAVSEPDDPEATSVSRMLAAAAEAGGDEHHFRVLQVPMNLFESGGALIRNTGERHNRTALEEASSAGLGVLINRPLNAFSRGRLIRLAGARASSGEGSIEPLVLRLRELGAEYRAGFGPAPAADGSHPAPDDRAGAAESLFLLVDEIAGLPAQVEDEVQWQQIEQQYVIPRINYVVGTVAQGLPPEARQSWSAWWARYLPALQTLLQEIGRQAAKKGGGRAASIGAAIDPALPPERRAETLSRKALWVIASTPGVSSVLVGMRRPAYVQDATGILAWPPLSDPLSVYPRLPK